MEILTIFISILAITTSIVTYTLSLWIMIGTEKRMNEVEKLLNHQSTKKEVTSNETSNIQTQESNI